ncbi:MAG TPA: hypothetical protein VHA75_19630 [Rugosimonospora sp.]|nr:hypothetical protein [Rugosimonospora sp.]
MSFIQIVEYETDRQAEMEADMRANMPEPGQEPWTRLEVTEDRDHPGRYEMIVEFPSYEVAMENSHDPRTQEMAKRMASMCNAGPTYRNLNVMRQM